MGMHPYGTQYQTSDQQKLTVGQKTQPTNNADLLSGNPNWLFNVVPDAPTWNMIEMDYTTDKRYDVSHCFNHIYVPENATFESWTTKVIGMPEGAYIYDDTVVSANEYVYPHAHWKNGDNFFLNVFSYGGSAWPPNPAVGTYTMCNETHGWYKDTWKSGNLAPTYGNLQSDVFTSWGPFDTPGSLWEATLMNAGRKRRDAPTHPSQTDDGYSSIAPVIPYTTEELERLQSGRSAHTLRAEYLDAAGYAQNFPYHDTKYTSAIDADTDLYWDMNNFEGATAGHPTIVQHIAST